MKLSENCFLWEILELLLFSESVPPRQKHEIKRFLNPGIVRYRVLLNIRIKKSKSAKAYTDIKRTGVFQTAEKWSFLQQTSNSFNVWRKFIVRSLLQGFGLEAVDLSC